jgi:hypothetical protein
LNVPPNEWVSLRIEMDGAASAELRSYQVKALPAVQRYRTLTWVLACADHETDRYGTPIGSDGYGWMRVQELEALESAADVTLMERFTRAGTVSDQVVIDKVSFVETARPLGETPIGTLVVTATTVV